MHDLITQGDKVIIFIIGLMIVCPMLFSFTVFAEENLELDMFDFDYNEYFVAKNGNDSNSGNESAPWLTIQKAADTANASDIVYIKQGTYSEKVILKKSGNESSPITFSAYQDDRVILDGTDLSFWWTGLIEIVNISYVTILNITFQNSPGFGIYCTGNLSKNITIRYCNFENCEISAVKMAGRLYPGSIKNITVSYNTVENVCISGSQEGISFSGVDNFIISYNTVNCVNKEGIDAKSGCSHGAISRNIVYAYDQIGIYVDAYDLYNSHIDVFENTIYGDYTGISLATEKGGNLYNISVFNNLVLTKAHGFQINNQSLGSNMKRNISVLNNVFYQNSVGVFITDQASHYENFTIRNNIFNTTRNQIFFATMNESDATIDHNLFAGESPIYGENATLGNPLFRDPQNGDFHLRESSPAIDNGSSVNAPLLDYDGNTRPYGDGWDIGAFEFMGGYPNSPPTVTNPSIANGSTGVSIDTSSLQITIRDIDNDTLSWTISTQPDVGSENESQDSNGEKICLISSLQYSTTYYWTIRVTDNSTWTNETLSFTTENQPARGGGSSPPASPPSSPSSPPYSASSSSSNHPPGTPEKPEGCTFIEVGVSYAYTSSSSDGDEDMIRYRFDWGDGSLSDWSSYKNSDDNITMSHFWTEINNYSIRVISQDESEENSSWSEPHIVVVSLLNLDQDPPCVDLNYSKIPSEMTISFNASKSYDNSSNITSYIWDFGDGTQGSGETPDHTYEAPGSYLVTLSVTDENGNTETKMVTIQVSFEGEENALDPVSGLFNDPIIIIIGIILLIIGSGLIVFGKKIRLIFINHQIQKLETEIEQFDQEQF